MHSASETLSRLAITPSTITPSTPITAFVRCLRSRSSLLRIRSSYAAVREHISSHCSLALQLKNVKGYPVLNVKVVFPYIIQHFLKFLVEFVDLFAR